MTSENTILKTLGDYEYRFFGIRKNNYNCEELIEKGIKFQINIKIQALENVKIPNVILDLPMDLLKKTTQKYNRKSRKIL